MIFSRISKAIALGLLLVSLGVFLVYQYRSIRHPYQLDYGEAAVLDQAFRLSQGENIYRNQMDEPPYSVSNYPPLYVVALVPCLKIFGPSFTFGRMLSLLCAIWTAIVIGRLLRKQTGNLFSAIAGGLLFLSIPFVVHWSSLVRIDLLALALSVTGLTILSEWPLSRNRLWTGAAFLVFAIYTRQSYIFAAPLAAFVGIFLVDRKKALQLAGIVILLTGFCFVTLNTLTQGGFYYGVFTANLQKVHWDRVFWKFAYLRQILGVLLLLAVVFVIFCRKEKYWALITSYLFAAGISAITIGKLGSNVNYFLELCVALSLAGILVVQRPSSLSGGTRTGGTRALYTNGQTVVWLLIAIQAAVCIHHTVTRYYPQLEARTSRIAELKALEKLVMEAKGPVLADEYAGMLTMHSRPLLIEPFIAAQMAEEKRWDPSRFIEQIRSHKFELILIHYFEFQPLYKERWTPEMLQAINESYVASGMLADTCVYRAR